MKHILVFVGRFRSLRAGAERTALVFFKKLKARGVWGVGKIEISLLSGTEMRAIKRRFLGAHVGPADVLAFPPSEGMPSPEGIVLGEVYVNADICRRNPHRLPFLLLHGILHLLGYGHEQKRDMLIMERLETELLSEVGIDRKALVT